MASCKKLLSELSNLLDEEIDPQLREELQMHMKACPDCWVVYDTTRRTILIFRGNDPYPLPDEVHNRLSTAVRRALEARVRAR